MNTPVNTAVEFVGRYNEIAREGQPEEYQLTTFEYEDKESGAFKVEITYERVYTDGFPDDFNPWAVSIKVSGDLNLTSMSLLGAHALIAQAVALHHQLGHHVEFDNDVNVAH